MIAREILQLLEAQAEQPVRRLERGLDDAVELEVGLDRRLVEIVARHAHLLGIIAPVPRLDGDVVALRLRLRLQVVALAPRRGRRAGAQTSFRSFSTASGVFAMVSASLKSAKVS